MAKTNQEIADIIRESLRNGRTSRLETLANELDPQPMFPAGTYVTAFGTAYVMADKTAFLSKGGSREAVTENYPIFFAADGHPMYSSGGSVVKWLPDPNEQNPWFDNQGKICPASFGVQRKFEKGKIYSDGNGLAVIRFFDGMKFVMPGQPDMNFEEMGKFAFEATHATIAEYFRERHGVNTAAALALAYAKKM